MKLLCAFLAAVFVQAALAAEEFNKEEEITLQKYSFRDGGEKKLIRVGDKVRNQPLPKLDSDGDDPKVSALIDRIIAENGGGPSPVASAGAGR